MVIVSKVLPLLLLVVCAAASGCKRAASPVQEPVAVATPSVAPAEPSASPAGGTTLLAETRYFKGSIGSSLGLQMKLVRQGDVVTGSYSYQKVGARIDLKGSIDKEGNLTLEEFDDGGKQTGVFKGLWTTGGGADAATIAGNWSRPDGQKKTAFSLHQQPIELSGIVEVIGKQVKETNKKLNCQIDAEYPQLSGLLTPNQEKFNQEVKSVVLKRVGEFKKNLVADEATEGEDGSPGRSTLDVGYTIALARDDFISVGFEVGTYYQGAAHPNSSSYAVNFDLKNSKVVNLGDLFKPGAKYLQAIAAYCISDLKKQSKEKDNLLDDASIESGASAAAKNYRSWTITKKGLGVAFDSYQVGPYAAGPQYVLVPYAAIKDIVNPEGLAGPLAR